MDARGGAPQADEPSVVSSKRGAETSQGGGTSTTGRASKGASSEEGTTDHGAAGAAVELEPAPPPPPPPTSCDLNGSCVSSSCEDSKLSCGVISTGAFCEFEGFSGATAPTACNQRAVIGTACCGACGCVPVEVYFDGTYCWQGMPQCKEDNLSNRMFYAHLPTTPNASFTLRDDASGSFFLGAGGFAGSGAGGAAGNSGGDAGNSGSFPVASAGSAGDPAHASGGAGSGGTGGGAHAEAGSAGQAGAPVTLGSGGDAHAGSAGAP